MALDLNLIKTIVIVMMENRSFDNILGYLSLAPYDRVDVDGLKSDDAWLNKFANTYSGTKFPPFLLTDPYHAMDTDPLHERSQIRTQLGDSIGGVFPLDGFVANYAKSGGKCLTAQNPPPVMGYFTADQVPVTDFFAKNFTICDRWFCSLPAGTQPNRLMAMGGESSIEVNHVPIPLQNLVFDWLKDNSVPWRVYHEGMPFFALMERWIPDILLDNNFRSLERLSQDIDDRDDEGDKFPKVIFIEPTYTDATHIGPSSDDHAPSAVKGGQEFLSTIYRLMTSDPDFWRGLVMIVTYDEHGGFFDHVSPPGVRTSPPAGANYPIFETLGVRVPAFVISPFVEPGTVCHDLMDHTSILKFLATKFKGGTYLPSVDQRQVGNAFDIFKDQQPPLRNAPAMPSLDAYLAKATPSVGYTPGHAPSGLMQAAFQHALEKIRQTNGQGDNKFSELLQSFPPKAPDV